jgi:hypothetical protein
LERDSRGVAVRVGASGLETQWIRNVSKRGHVSNRRHLFRQLLFELYKPSMLDRCVGSRAAVWLQFLLGVVKWGNAGLFGYFACRHLYRHAKNGAS